MTYSENLGIICAASAGIVLLIVIVFQVRQSILRRKGSPASEASDAAVPLVVPAALHVPQPVQTPQVLAAEAAAMPAPNPDGAENPKPITSQEIVTRLKELPTVQAEIEKEKYQGVKVEWTLYFSSLMLKGQDRVEVSLLNINNAYPTVSFIAEINQYPELWKIQQGMPVFVRGEISRVYSMVIVLTDVELSFPDAA